MPNRMKKLEEALKMAGASFQRHRKHKIYRLPNGRMLTVSGTPGDGRAEKNALSRLKRLQEVK